ncbi:response regulator [Phormidium tenue FACHB-886]|nr:response regulator [Phormidium tenue FACHB-886]
MLSEQQQRIMGYFIEEAKDHLNTIEQGLLNLQSTIADPEIVSEVFRAAHSVKGGAAMLGLNSIQYTAHRLEDYFKVLKECPIKVDQRLETLFLRVYDTLHELIDQLQGPFGLTDDKAQEAMAGVEPVFTELGQHLSVLVSQSGSRPPEDVELLVVAQPVLAQPVAAQSAIVREESALQLIFQSDVPAQLRELLQLFKQNDTAETRQQLQAICRNLSQAGEQLDLPNWCELLKITARVIGNSNTTYRALAPLVIKDIKRAQELVLAGRSTEITACESLLELVPAEAAPTPFTDTLTDTALADLLATMDAGEVSREAISSSDRDNELADMLLESEAETGSDENWFDPALEEPSISSFFGDEDTSALELDLNGSATNSLLEFDLGANGETASRTANSADLSLIEELDGDSLLKDQSGPEVGVAELNSLADLFEGEMPELGLTWQAEEVISPGVVLPSYTPEPPNEFSDLLFTPDSSDTLTFDEDDDLSGLLNNSAMMLDSQQTLEKAPETIPPSAFAESEPADDFFNLTASTGQIDSSTAIDDFDALLFEADRTVSRNESNFENLDELLAGLDIEGLSAKTGDRQANSNLNDLDDIFAGALDSPETLFDNPFDTANKSVPEELFPGSADLNFDVQPETDVSNDTDLTDITADLWNEVFTGDRVSDLGSSDDSVSAFHLLEPDLRDFDLSADNPFSPVEELPDLTTEFGGATEESREALDLDLFDSNPFEEQSHLGSSASDLELAIAESAVAPSEVNFFELNALEDTREDDLEDFSVDNTPLGKAVQPGDDAALDQAETNATHDNSSFDLSALFDEEATSDPLTEPIQMPAVDAASMENDLANLFQNDVGLTLSEVEQPLEEGLFQPEVLDAAELGTDSQDRLELDDLLVDGTQATQDFSLENFDLTLDESDAIALDINLDQATDFPANTASNTAEAMIAQESFDLTLGSELAIPSSELNVEPLEAITPAGSPFEWENDLWENNLDEALVLDEAANFTLTSDLEDSSEPPATTDDFASLDSLLDEASAIESSPVESSSLSAADDFLNAADDFTDLDALLEEEVVSAAPIFSSSDDFADLDALLEEAPAVAAFAVEDSADLDSMLDDETASPTFPISSPPNTEDEFGDLEDLLKDADQKLGGTTAARGNRPVSSTANRRPQRRNTLGDQTMRVSVKHLDNLNNLVGEMVVNRNSLEQAQERLRQFLDNLLYQVQQLSDVGQRMRDLYERSLLESSLLSNRRSYQLSSQGSSFSTVQSNHATGMSFDALEMDRFTGFHTLSQEMIELIVRVRESASDIDFVVDESDQVTRNFRQITTQLQEGLTRSRMVPFAQTADRLPRGVRDNSLKYGKQAELTIEGRDTLIDKMIVEQLYDPMTHLVNNAVAHGIETPAERVAAGKPPTGKITIRAFHQGNQTVISVSDDGAGINPEAVKAKAVAKGVITPAQSKEMSRLDTYDLLFHHGFSTVDQVDDLRGRGIGLDVVRSNLNEIRGVISIDSTIGKGTTFTIRLPLTLSISKALCCISNRARIAFPMDGVEDMLDVPKERVQIDEQGRTSIYWRDTLLPFQPLPELLALNRVLGRGSVYGGNQEEDIVSIVVLRSAGNFLALQVDQVLGEQEIVIKQLEGPVPKPIGIAGATVLGDGRIMPIADVLELIDLSQGRIRREAGSLLWEKGAAPPQEMLDIKSEPTVLIVDDSITVRELLSMTFNKVGYRVEQARDGQEAWEKLRSGLPCDLVFCDIEMPRMDGLELLSRIQKDPHLMHLPIAMLTSRGADRHRQMAVQLGAKGYFTKPYLEEMLLDAAQRMLKGEVLVTSSQ